MSFSAADFLFPPSRAAGKLPLIRPAKKTMMGKNQGRQADRGGSAVRRTVPVISGETRFGADVSAFGCIVRGWETMSFLFHKGLALAGCRDNPQQRQKLFEHFGGGEDLRRLCARIDAAADSSELDAADPFDTSFPDPNLIAGYFDEPSAQSDYQRRYEEACRDSDILMNEAVSTAQILRLFQEEPTSAPKSCRQRAYQVGESSREKPLSPTRRKSGILTSFFHSRKEPKAAPDRAYDELSRFESRVSDPVPRRSGTPQPIELRAPAEPIVIRREEVRSEEPAEKKRGVFLPFVCAAIAAALLFHYYPVLHPKPTLRTPQSVENCLPPPENNDNFAEKELLPAVIEPDSEQAADGPGEFEEAPMYDKIATPPQSGLELVGAYHPAAGTFSWRDISLLSDPEKAAMDGVRPVLRPLRRGVKTSVVTAIPQE